ncbi:MULTISPECIES: TRAP transporter small permease [Mumia]|uniref:TRAP transporter small permease n=1 Tax=Mumia TaxID=1546255 RepID=UPI001423E434|nr:TRAP transporter small permease [Mumia sp. ZJ430]
MTYATPPLRGPERVKAFFDAPPRWASRTVRVLTAIELAIGIAALLLIFFLVLAQAAQRYLPFDGWPWTGELARFCLVWLTFVVAGVLVTSDSHIAIEMVDAIDNEVVRRIVRVISCVVVAAVGAALTAEAWSLTMDQGIIKSPAMRMPMSWLYAISLVGFVSTTLRAAFAAVQYAVVGVPQDRTRDMEAPVA